MLALSSYKNFVVNIYYLIGLYSSDYVSKLDVGSCNADDYKRNLQILRSLFNVIKCYEYPFEVLLSTPTYVMGTNYIDLSSSLSSDYIFSPYGVSIIGTTLTNEPYIIGYDDYLKRIYLSENMTGTNVGDLYLQNNKENCIPAEDFHGIVDLLNKILGTHYCVNVETDYTI